MNWNNNLKRTAPASSQERNEVFLLSRQVGFLQRGVIGDGRLKEKQRGLILRVKNNAAIDLISGGLD
jgi:hypothetical protein